MEDLFPLQILATPECLTDLATTQFDISQCPGLLAMLDALNLGNTNPPVNCELSCVEQFNLVGGCWVGSGGHLNRLCLYVHHGVCNPGCVLVMSCLH